MNTSTNEMPFKRLTPDSKILPFDCGNPDLTDYLFSSAKADMKKLLSVTYYLEAEGKTVLFFTLSNDKIAEITQKGGEPLFSNSFFRKIKDKFGRAKHRSDYPAVKIGRFGVNTEYQATGNHWGSKTLDFIKYWMITNNKTGCCFITVDAYATAVGFYINNGFKFLGEKERKGYETWRKENPDFRNGNINDDIPTFAMYFNLLSLIAD
ncbi:MAG: GNAT family N-acetyltransferase [Muribaculaceae bacterium]|nr:GNAT family N-acetyltransferase [Muribaculaceae bacterium]